LPESCPKDTRNTRKPQSTKTLTDGGHENVKEQSETEKGISLKAKNKVNGKEQLFKTTAKKKLIAFLC
jgi:hypothetical protein